MTARERRVRGPRMALLGGEPLFDEPLYVGRPNIGDPARLAERVTGMLERRWLTNNGVLVQEFEERIAERAGVRYALACCNATVALQLATQAAGLTGEVLVPAFTFVATAHALQWMGITPVFCDVDPCTHNIDPRAAEALITPRTTGILGVHLWGRACAVDELTALATRHGLRLLFDAAHAFGCTLQGRPIGGCGLAEVFSFHATKVLNSCEGGAIVTNDDEFAERVRMLRNFGFAGYDEVVALGVNGKMSEICAAMGLTNLEHMDEFVAANRRNEEAYATALADVPGVRLLREIAAEEPHNHHYIVLAVDERAAGLSRDALVHALHAERVIARRYFAPGCHRMEPYRSLCPGVGERLPHTERLAQCLLALPNGTAVAPETCLRVGELIATLVARAEDRAGPRAGRRDHHAPRGRRGHLARETAVSRLLQPS